MDNVHTFVDLVYLEQTYLLYVEKDEEMNGDNDGYHGTKEGTKPEWGKQCTTEKKTHIYSGTSP